MVNLDGLNTRLWMHRGLSRRDFLRLTAIGAASISPMLAACGGDNDDGEPAAESDSSDEPTTTEGGSDQLAATETSEEPAGDAEPTVPSDADEPTAAGEGESGDAGADAAKQGGELIIANEQSPVSLDPHFVRDVGSSRAMFYMYDSLIEVNKDTELEPWLAKSWEISEDGLQYILELEENVTFHDGTPFNAEAVKYNLERQWDDSLGTVYIDDFKLYLESVDAVDEFTAQLNFKQMYALFARDFLAWGAGHMISPTAAQEMGADFAQQPVGSGPFKFQEFVRDSHLAMVRNDDYWAGAPFLDSLQVRIIPEQGVQIFELEAGNIDISFSIQAKDVERLEDADVGIVNQLAPTATWISMNLAKGVTQELAVRQAIALTVDREAVVSELLLGYGQVSRGGAVEGWPRYHEDIPPVEYNPDKARSILDEAGWVEGADGIRERDGQPLKVNVLSTQLERALSYGLMNELIDQALRDVGFQTELQTMEWGTYLDQFRAGDWWEVTFHAQNASAYSETGATLDPDGYWNVNQHAKVPADSEVAGVADQIRDIMAELEQTIDPDERVEIYKGVQMLASEYQLLAWLVHWDFLVGVQPRVKDLTVKPALSDTLHKIHLTWVES